jgi:hypothetical protein
MLESIKNSLIGRVHDPHSYFIQHGVHAITFMTYGSDDKMKQSHRTKDMFNVIERILRISDQLDEQLHAGYYFYILTSTSKFVSNSVFVWPIVLLILGLCAPFWLDYYTH